MNLDECEHVFDLALSSKSEASFSEAIEPLFKEYEILSLKFGRGSIFWRARIINSDIYENLDELDYPPGSLAKQGRLNDNSSPCFYIAAHKETALAEVEAKENQLVQLAGFRIKTEAPLHLAVIGEFANVHKSGYMHVLGKDPGMAISQILNSLPRQEALKKLYIDKFFASVLADPNASTHGYMFSRALGKSIYARNSAQGIIFPSVKDRGGVNIAVQAIPSDNSFENVCCLVVRTGKKRKFGMIDFSIEKSAERLDEDSNFVWRESGDPEVIGLYNMNQEEFELVSRDPADRNALLKMLHPRTEYQ